MIFTKESLQSGIIYVLPQLVRSFNLTLEVAKGSPVLPLNLLIYTDKNTQKFRIGRILDITNSTRAGDVYSNHSLKVDPTCSFSARAVVCK